MNPSNSPAPNPPVSTAPNPVDPSPPKGKPAPPKTAATTDSPARVSVLPNENPAIFDAHWAGYREFFAPANAVEEDLVFELAHVRWRQRRLWSNESALIERTMRKMAPELAQTDPTIDQRTRVACACDQLAAHSVGAEFSRRYDSTLRRLYDRALANLAQVRAWKCEQPDPQVPLQSTNPPDSEPNSEPA